MKEQQDRQDCTNMRVNSAPTLTTLTQSDHDIIRSFLNSVPPGFPLSPGAALAEMTGFAPLSPGMVGLGVSSSSSHNYHSSPSRFEAGSSPGRFGVLSDSLLGYKGRNVNSPLRVNTPPRNTLDSPHRLPSAQTSPQRPNDQGGSMKKYENVYSYSPVPHRRSPSPSRPHQSPYRVPQYHVYAPILPSRAFDFTTPAPSPPSHQSKEDEGVQVDRLDVPTLVREKAPEIELDLVMRERTPEFQAFDDPQQTLQQQQIQCGPLQDGRLVNETQIEQANTEEYPKKFQKKKKKWKVVSKAKQKNAGRKTKTVVRNFEASSKSAQSQVNQNTTEAVAVEKSSEEVKTKLLKGCSCGQSCFDGLNPVQVFRHRTNISRLTKAELDMYLMGMMMCTLADPNQTYHNKERKRSRNKYIYQGSEVCLDAYLYLENVTIYQIKLIRKHVTEVGVVPRLHKNSGKKPINSISCDHHQEAHVFIQEFLASENSGRKKGRCALTLKNLHEKYRDHFSLPGKRTMALSTFRKFVNQRFPLVKFKLETSEQKKRKEDLDAINLPPTDIEKDETQIVRNMSKIAKIGEG